MTMIGMACGVCDSGKEWKNNVVLGVVLIRDEYIQTICMSIIITEFVIEWE